MTSKTMIPSSSTLNTALIIAAAGSSTRMGGSVKKEYLPLKEGTVLSTAAKAFLKAAEIKSLFITIPADGKDDAFSALFEDPEIGGLLKDVNLNFIEGGSTRQKSIYNALLALDKLDEKPELVLIHDGARPFVSAEVIQETIKAATEYGAAVPGLEPVDTQKMIDENGFITEHLKRASMTAVQTPQAFEFEKLLNAHKKAAEENIECTDDTEIWGKYCGKVKTVKGDPKNIKITYPKDYKASDEKGSSEMMLRTGLGYDLHRLTEGRKLVIGGIEIPFEKGEDGHSDGDCLLHAITDALLGASGLGDIGSYFPPEDAEWKDADSIMLLKTVWSDIQKEGWKLNNLDCVIKLEKPKFLPYRNQVIESIAKALGVENSQVFVKAKTGEKLGDVGSGNAIEAWVSCILVK